MNKYYKTIPTKELSVAELLEKHASDETFRCVAAHDESITSQQTVETETDVDEKKEPSFQQELLDGLKPKSTVAVEFDGGRRFGFPIGLTVKQQTELVSLVSDSRKVVQTIPEEVRNELSELFDVEFGKNPAEASINNEENLDFMDDVLQAFPSKDRLKQRDDFHSSSSKKSSDTSNNS